MKILKDLWQFPQLWLGFALLFIYTVPNPKKFKKKERYKETSVYYIEGFPNGISLSQTIILNSIYLNIPDSVREKTIMHEYGHFIQSQIFGPLYLIVIGLPSIVMNIISIFSRKFGKGKFANNYYNRWPESWADKLGGVDR